MISDEIESGRIVLTPLTEDFVTEKYRDWLLDPEVNKSLETRFEVPTLDSLRAYVRQMRSSSDSYLFGIIVKETSNHCGNIKLGLIDHHHLTASIGLMIGDQNSWGKGFATEAIGAVTRWAFSQLNLQKLTAGSYSANIGSVRAFEKSGFAIEGIQRSQVVLADSTRSDVVVLGLTHSDFSWRD